MSRSKALVAIFSAWAALTLGLVATAPQASAYTPPAPNCTSYIDIPAVSVLHPTTQMLWRWYRNCPNGLSRVDAWAYLPGGWVVVGQMTWWTHTITPYYWTLADGRAYEWRLQPKNQPSYATNLDNLDEPLAWYYEGWYTTQSSSDGVISSFSCKIKASIFNWAPLIYWTGPGAQAKSIAMSL